MMLKHTVIHIILASLLAIALPSNARSGQNMNIMDPEAPITLINLVEVPAGSIASFVTDWNESSKATGQAPGFIDATLYRSLVPDARYQFIAVAQWQSYNAWIAASGNPAHARSPSGDPGRAEGIRMTSAFCRPAAYSVNIYAELFSSGEKRQAPGNPRSLERGSNNPEIPSPDSPFVFINLMEMKTEDIRPFVAEWPVRARIMGQMPAAMSSTLYRSLLPGSPFQVINVSQWQSYDGFIAAYNDQRYASELAADLAQVPSIKLTRGFYRPVAKYVRLYSGEPE